MEARPKWYSQKSMLVFLHVAAWLVVIVLPFLLRPPVEDAPWRQQRERHFEIIYTATNLMLIAIFYLNIFILIPRLLNRKKLISYLASLVFLFVVMLSVSYFINHRQMNDLVEFSEREEFLMPERFPEKLPESFPERRPGRTPPQMLFFISIFPFLFVVTSSLAYSYITDRAKNEKLLREKETENLKSELSFLRSQVSPHFMFNVMNSVVSLARAKSDRVEPVVIQLSHLLRYMLYESDGDKVSLDKEVEYIKIYIDLQKMRFDETVAINFNISGNTDEYFIEPMLLIPFVENAFKHGIGLIQNPEIIINLSVDDTGLLKFLVKNKYNPVSFEKKDSFSGIGLTNVRRRLNLLYAQKSTLTVNAGTDWYTTDLTVQLK